MSGVAAHRDWIRLVLEADGLSDYRDQVQHRHRVDWIGRTLSFASTTTVGFLMVAVAMGLAQSRPEVSAGQERLRASVMTEQQRTEAAQREYLQARAVLASTQAAVRPDLDGALAAEFDLQGAAAAFVGLRGPGLVLMLNDAKHPTFEGTTDLGRVIDRDVQHVVNGLWASGAEGISIDGIRLTARTSIRNAGNAILVDYTPVSTPLEIRALGNARAMAAALRSSPEWSELTQLRDRYGVRWDLSLKVRLVLPAGTSGLPTLARTVGVA